MPSTLPCRYRSMLMALAIVAPAVARLASDSWWGLMSLMHFDLVYLLAIFVAVVFTRQKPLKLAAVFIIGLGLTCLLYWQMVNFRCPGAGLAAISWPDLLLHSLVLIGLVLILLGIDTLAASGPRWLLKSLGRPDKSWDARLVVGAARLLVVWLVVIPWLFVFLQTHRPKLNYPERPAGSYCQFNLDGLVVWHQRPSRPSNVVVLLVHGIGGDQGDMHFYREMFHEMGYHVVSLDLPGLGRSAGLATTFGVRERPAVAQVASWARDHARDPGTGQVEPVLIGLGTSMGGTSLLLAAERNPEFFDGLIIDSAYARLEDMAEHQLARLPRLLTWPMRTVGRAFIAAELGALIESVDAVRNMRKLDDIPKLFVHGDADSIVPIAQGRLLFSAAGGAKRWLQIEGADHVHSIVADYQQYRKAAGELIEQVVRDRAADITSPTTAGAMATQTAAWPWHRSIASSFRERAGLNNHLRSNSTSRCTAMPSRTIVAFGNWSRKAANRW